MLALVKEEIGEVGAGIGQVEQEVEVSLDEEQAGLLAECARWPSG